MLNTTLASNNAKRISLSGFIPRPYQIPVIRALEHDGFRKIVCILPRRSGKDFMCFWMLIRQAFKRVSVYFMIYPTATMGRKILWDSITHDGIRFLDLIPKELVLRTNATTMSIYLINGSIIQVVGSMDSDSLVGTNCYGVVFSEYAMQNPMVYNYIKPILNSNGGFAIFISTPRGKNHLYNLFQIAKDNPDQWFSYHKTVDQTQHIPLAEIEKERAEGLISEDMILQEYYCSWDMGVEGSYYSKYIDKMHLDNRITDVPFDYAYRVHTSWDLGMADNTSIIFFQSIGPQVRIINTYSSSGHGLDHYIKVLQTYQREHNYTYGVHIAPHDIQVRELGTGMSRLEKARQLGLDFIVAPSLKIDDGIEAVRTTLPRCWIDRVRCKELIRSLENYRHEYDARHQVYKTTPLHDFSSHFADAMRYLAISLDRTADSLSAEMLDARYHQAMYGQPNNMPAIFRDDSNQNMPIHFNEGSPWG